MEFAQYKKSSVLYIVSLFFCVLIFGIFTKTFAQETPYFGNQNSNTEENSTSFEPGVGDPNLPFSSKFPQIKEQLVTEVSPEVPKPGDEVTITAELYGDININTILLTWKINGRTELSGIGKKEFTFTMPEAGKLTTVTLEANPRNAPIITKTFNFAPVDVDILWQANTYTPPFYKGKALFTPESNVTFIALPNIIVNNKKVDSTETVYTWSVNRTVDGPNSGFGKSSYNYTGSILLRPVIIEVEAYAAANTAFKGKNMFQLKHVFPQALIYEDHPLYGILFNKALVNQYTPKGDEVELSAVPYFFSTQGRNTSTSFKWNLNNSPLVLPDFQNSAIFRRKDNKKGSAVISLTIGNPEKILQKAVTGFNLIFNEKSSSFGQ